MLKSREALPPDFYTVLVSDRGPEFLCPVETDNFLHLQNISKVNIMTGTRKSLFIGSFLDANFRHNDASLETQVVPPHWQEDLHKDSYLMPGISPVLKAGVLPTGATISDGELNISSDVSTTVDGHPLHRQIASSSTQIKEALMSTLTQEHTVSVNSQIAGLLSIHGEATGAVINPTTSFTTSEFTADEVTTYFGSLGESELRRAPGAILWAHPLIWNHITSIDGVTANHPDFPAKQHSLLQSLLGVPDDFRCLIEFLDKVGEFYTDNQTNLFGLIHLEESGLLSSNQKLLGSWHELIPNNEGELLMLRNAAPSDYLQMSEIARRNFCAAPNYAYLRKPENFSYLEQYIEANSPSGILDLCSRGNNICNLVVDGGEKLLGFRVVRKNEDIADGRRMHTALDVTNRGIGRFLLRRSEEIAKQAGCTSMEVHATGESYAWFERNGFVDHGIRPNTISDYHLMIKSL